MRTAISFIGACAFTFSGLYLIYLLTFESSRQMGIVAVPACVLTFLGVAWLWSDFIRPTLSGQKRGPDSPY